MITSTERSAPPSFINHLDADLPPTIRLWLMRILLPLRACNELLYRHNPGSSLAFQAFSLKDVSRDGLGEYERASLMAAMHEQHQALEAEYQDCASSALPAILARNLRRIAALVGLDDTEQSILAFSICIHNEPALEEALCALGNLSSNRLPAVLATVLQLPLDEVRLAMEPRSTLFRSGLLLRCRHFHRHLHEKLELISPHFAELMCSSQADPITFLADMIQPSPWPELTLEDYAHIQRLLNVLLPTLRQALIERKTGINVLIHGAPGTGKTQLVRALAQEMKQRLFEVSCEDEEGGPVDGLRRLRSYQAAQCFLSQRQSMLLFDDIDDILHCSSHWNGSSAAARSKSWLNRSLEDNPIPTFWLTNSPENLDPAYIRRFTLCIALDTLPRRQRLRMIENNSRGQLDSTTTARLADAAQLSPAVLRHATGLVNEISSGEAKLDSATLFDVINGTLRAQGLRPVSRKASASLPDYFDPLLLNTDADLLTLAQGLKEADSARLCFHGPSGTGKSACAQWLARELDRPLLVRRGSDLLSCWLGQTEQNIARTFSQASQEGAILLIDEADTFLQSRQRAQHNWELSMVNEMLTGMEQFDGLLIMSTNLLDTLDNASLRRFDRKLHFAYLTPVQSWAMLQALCDTLMIPAPVDEDWFRIKDLKQLTPGDFSLLARRHRIEPFSSAAAFISALSDETALKNSVGKQTSLLH